MKRPPTLPVVLLLVLAPILASGQEWTAQVVDAQTGEAIAYASIGIIGGTQGTLTDPDGFFTLRTDANAGDSVRISSLGYRSMTYATGQLPKGTVELEPQAITMDVIEVSGLRLGPLRTIGVTEPPTNVTIIFQSKQLGTELGALLDLPRKSAHLIKGFNFYLKRNPLGNVKFRVHLYKATGKGVEKLTDLLPQSVFVETGVTSGWVNVDISDLNIVLDKRSTILCTLEWIEDSHPEQSVTDLEFGGVLGSTASIYFKRAVESDWEHLKKQGPGLLFEVGFNVEAYEVNR